MSAASSETETIVDRGPSIRLAQFRQAALDIASVHFQGLQGTLTETLLRGVEDALQNPPYTLDGLNVCPTDPLNQHLLGGMYHAAIREIASLETGLGEGQEALLARWQEELVKSGDPAVPVHRDGVSTPSLLSWCVKHIKKGSELYLRRLTWQVGDRNVYRQRYRLGGEGFLLPATDPALQIPGV